MYGRVVRQARLARGLSQVQLASIADVEQSNISAIETGRRIPTVDTLHRLLAACGFELLAAAGTRSIAFPMVDIDELVEQVGLTGSATADADDSPAVRARKLAAALDLAEAIMRSRR